MENHSKMETIGMGKNVSPPKEFKYELFNAEWFTLLLREIKWLTEQQSVVSVETSVLGAGYGYTTSIYRFTFQYSEPLPAKYASLVR